MHSGKSLSTHVQRWAVSQAHFPLPWCYFGGTALYGAGPEGGSGLGPGDSSYMNKRVIRERYCKFVMPYLSNNHVCLISKRKKLDLWCDHFLGKIQYLSYQYAICQPCCQAMLLLRTICFLFSVISFSFSDFYSIPFYNELNKYLTPCVKAKICWVRN